MRYVVGMRLLLSGVLTAFFVGGCASPQPRSYRQAMAEQDLASRPSDFEINAVACRDRPGEPVLPHSEAPRLSYDAGCKPQPVWVRGKR
ncbi:MAG: hypothetical protein ACT4PZ_12745 [Panacagrimonas sp.]